MSKKLDGTYTSILKAVFGVLYEVHMHDQPGTLWQPEQID